MTIDTTLTKLVEHPVPHTSELINMARILIEAGKYDLPVSDDFWRQHRMGRADDTARSEFLKGFIHGIASFREIQKISIASVA